MTDTSTIEESKSPVLEPLGPTLEKQVAEIIGAAEDQADQGHEAQLNVEEQADNALNLAFSVPMPGVRYYTYL